MPTCTKSIWKLYGERYIFVYCSWEINFLGGVYWYLYANFFSVTELLQSAHYRHFWDDISISILCVNFRSGSRCHMKENELDRQYRREILDKQISTVPETGCHLSRLSTVISPGSFIWVFSLKVTLLLSHLRHNKKIFVQNYSNVFYLIICNFIFDSSCKWHILDGQSTFHLELHPPNAEWVLFWKIK